MHSPFCLHLITKEELFASWETEEAARLVMESIMAVLDSIYLHFSPENKVQALKPNCHRFLRCLKHVKPLLQELMILASVTSDEAIEMLKHALDEAKLLIDKAAGAGSKFYLVRGTAIVEHPLTCKKWNKVWRCQLIVKMLQQVTSDIQQALNLLVLSADPSASSEVANRILQISRTHYFVDISDERLSEEIDSFMLDYREGKMIEIERFRRLASKLDIRCNKTLSIELDALQQERDAAKNQLEKYGIDCLVALLKQLRRNNTGSDTKQEEAEIWGVPIPSDFRCPLSLELMVDPVIVASGQTYERSYIQKWLNQGERTCPKTRQPLSHENLIPNYTVKALITGWCEVNNVPLPEYKAELIYEKKPSRFICRSFSSSLVSDSSGRLYPKTIRSMSYTSQSNKLTTNDDFDEFELGDKEMQGFVMRMTDDAFIECDGPMLDRSHSAQSCIPNKREHELSRWHSLETNMARGIQFPDRHDFEEPIVVKVHRLVGDLRMFNFQKRAAAELRHLAKDDMNNRILIANAGAITPLVGLLDSSDPETVENAVTALLNLSINDNNKSEIAAAGAIDPLVRVLEFGASESVENAAAALFSLSIVDDNKSVIGASGAIPPLVELLAKGSLRGKKDAATALFSLSIYHENKARMVVAGAVKTLLELMGEPSFGMVDKSVAILANLATTPEGRISIEEEGGIFILVEVLEAGSPRGKENAAAALLHLCTNSNKHRAMVLQEGAVPPLHALSQSGTARAKEKASALLRHFREERRSQLL